MSTTLKWGLITGMVYVIFSLVSNLLGLQQRGSFSPTTLLVNGALFAATFYTIYLGIREVRDSNMDGYLSFGLGLRTGLGIALIAALITALFMILYMTVIDPGMAQTMMNTIEEGWEKRGMSEEQMEAARKWSGMMFKPWLMAMMVIVSVLFWGLIKSLIASSMLKKDAPPSIPSA